MREAKTNKWNKHREHKSQFTATSWCGSISDTLTSKIKGSEDEDEGGEKEDEREIEKREALNHNTVTYT